MKDCLARSPIPRHNKGKSPLPDNAGKAALPETLLFPLRLIDRAICA
jgi:hypothetical protein